MHSGQCQIACPCEQGNFSLGYITGGKFFVQLSGNQLFRKDDAQNVVLLASQSLMQTHIWFVYVCHTSIWAVKTSKPLFITLAPVTGNFRLLRATFVH
jgi:hypothetical protein